MRDKGLPIILGPTGVGKTEIALRVAEELAGEIISCDSRKIYKLLDIGTAKPSKEERKKIPHHLIDIADLREEFSVADFKREAERKISQIQNREKLPLLVGGSPLYIKAVIDGLFSGPGKDPDLRKRLIEKAKKSGDEYLYRRLKKVDPPAAEKIHPHDLKRIIRALEIFELTGKPISYHQQLSSFNPQFSRLGRVIMIGLRRKREELYKRINNRVDKMLEAGLVGEVKELLKKGYSENLNSLQGLGYKQIIGYLKGRYNFKEAVRLLKRDTRRFAKRQMTWFRKDKRITWVDIEGNNNGREVVNKIKKILLN
jgi:tRNA dimethylallyltransferase